VEIKDVVRDDVKSVLKRVVCFIGREGTGKTQLKACLSKTDNSGIKTTNFTTDYAVAEQKGYSFEYIDTPGLKAKDKLIVRLKGVFEETIKINAIVCVISATRFTDEDYRIKKEFEIIQELYPNNTFYVITSCPVERVEVLKKSDDYKEFKFEEKDKIVFVENPNVNTYQNAPNEVKKWMEDRVKDSFSQVFDQIKIKEAVKVTVMNDYENRLNREAQEFIRAENERREEEARRREELNRPEEPGCIITWSSKKTKKKPLQIFFFKKTFWC